MFLMETNKINKLFIPLLLTAALVHYHIILFLLSNRPFSFFSLFSEHSLQSIRELFVASVLINLTFVARPMLFFNLITCRLSRSVLTKGFN